MSAVTEKIQDKFGLWSIRNLSIGLLSAVLVVNFIHQTPWIVWVLYRIPIFSHFLAHMTNPWDPLHSIYPYFNIFVFALLAFFPAFFASRRQGKWTFLSMMIDQVLWYILLFSFLYAQAAFYQGQSLGVQGQSISGGSGFGGPDPDLQGIPAEPIIYLYPPHTEKVQVALDFKGSLTSTYPAYNPAIKGWSVTAHSDGSLINGADGKEYSYLFWEGAKYDIPFDQEHGFVVKGSDTAAFLQSSLSELGLTPKEYNEFIVYWLPKMEHNPYNFIHFAGTEYTDSAPLTVTPSPDATLRVFMMFKPLQTSIATTPQILQPFTRHGFSVVEWGGMEVE